MLNNTRNQTEDTNAMTVGETKITAVNVADPTTENLPNNGVPRGVSYFSRRRRWQSPWSQLSVSIPAH